VRTRRRAGDRQHDGGAAQQPGERQLGGGRAVPADAGRYRRGDRQPGDEDHPVLFCISEHVFAGAVGPVVAVLHACNRHDLFRLGELLDGHFGQTRVPDLALVAELAQGADLVGERDVRVDAVQLVERELVQLEPAQAEFGLLAQVFGAAERDPLAAQVDMAALGGDHQIGRVRVQCLGQQLLVVAEVIGVGGVDEVDAEFDGAAGDPDRGRPVQPGRQSGQPHRAEPEPVNPQVTADGHGSCGWHDSISSQCIGKDK
jgi:hypothetical protein